MVKMSFVQMKEALNVSPRRCINQLRSILPRMLKNRMKECQTWLRTETLKISQSPENVDDFVNQLQAVDFIEDNFSYVKDLLELSNHHFELFKSFDMLSKEDIKQIQIDETYVQVNKLTSLIYDTKDKADKNKNDMKKVTKKMVPELKDLVETFMENITDPSLLNLTDVKKDLKPMLNRI